MTCNRCGTWVRTGPEGYEFCPDCDASLSRDSGS